MVRAAAVAVAVLFASAPARALSLLDLPIRPVSVDIEWYGAGGTQTASGTSGASVENVEISVGASDVELRVGTHPDASLGFIATVVIELDVPALGDLLVPLVLDPSGTGFVHAWDRYEAGGVIWSDLLGKEFDSFGVAFSPERAAVVTAFAGDMVHVRLGFYGGQPDLPPMPMTANLAFRTVVPEPGTASLLTIGASGLALSRRRRAQTL